LDCINCLGMIQDKSHEDPWMNYPVESLNKIIKLAFQRFENVEESDSALLLVSQLMDHYKEEITRFSLEISSFATDFAAYIKKYSIRLLEN